jgi:DNA repair exonuclease SbcCD ATPase subunit
MIQMPHRSVTRFFIPLIDVLLLLFSIFLLMPAFEGAEGKAKKSEEELTEYIDSLQQQLKRLYEDLKQFEKVRDPVRQLKELQAELERLRKEKEQALKRPNFVRVIDIDGKTGKLSFYDPTNIDNPRMPIPDKKTAQELIARHRKEAGKRLLYYHFLMPRQETGRPTQAQELEYRDWFKNVHNSLVKEPPLKEKS